jgi:hypothetical protein
VWTDIGMKSPASIDHATEAIRTQISLGRLSAVAICVLLADSRQRFFSDDASAWLTWSRDCFGFDRRHSFRCLKAGMLLLVPNLGECPMGHLLGCEPQKLEMLANIPAQQLPALLERWNPAEASREEVREKVKLWADDPDAAAQKLEEEARAKRKAPVAGGAASTVAKAMTRIQKILGGECRDEALAKLDVPAAIRTGYELVDAAMDAIDAGTEMFSIAQYDQFIEVAKAAHVMLVARREKVDK